MSRGSAYTIRVALTVALGGFLMGFDASVISGVTGFIETQFELSKLQLGWAVSSLTLTATLAMMVSGPLSDRYGRRPVLKVAAVLFAVSAVWSAFAPDFLSLVIARMLGGFGVGAALIIAPMYIAEIAPGHKRGRLVSFNQLNIVVGISAAFFSNYLILGLSESAASWVTTLGIAESQWRWMLGVEAIPAVLYFLALAFVPESPRWLAMQQREDEALEVLDAVNGPVQAKAELQNVYLAIEAEQDQHGVGLRALLHPSMKLVLTIGISVGVLQQITGINSVFFYAPMIFEQSGIGTNAAFMQAVLVGLVNVGFTLAAIALIDRLGRRPLLGVGLTGITVCMLTLAWAFGSASYQLPANAELPDGIDRGAIADVLGERFDSDVDFRNAVTAAIGIEQFTEHNSALVSTAIDANSRLILAAILGFVASFAISLGPVMWVLFSELFPNRVRGIAISFVGLINSAVAFLVTLVFPWQLENLGTSTTFLIYGVFAAIGFVFVMRILPETKGRSLEELETVLVKA
ncbi:MAG: sugar porter family MFS transporter [Pseudomonadota bacterium]